jgi:BirA family transcriptional regulator, biotin operon repressor / biotin---[acetyl-CoA-carboxylase] ligase
MLLDVRSYESVGSTMDVAAEALRAGAAEGTVIVAEEQTMGRGRRGRGWSSPAGAGLYLSFVFRPTLDALPGRLLPLLTLAAGVGVRRALERATGMLTELKWPNDVMVGRRKLAGILAEGIDIGAPAQGVVLGIGINTRRAAHPGDIAERATSLEQELGKHVEQQLVLDALLVDVPAAYAALCRGEVDDILRAWRAAAPSANGGNVEWDTTTGAKRGITEGIDEVGALLIRTSAGVERIISGDLRWL